MKLAVFWFRRDLRLKDNTALNHALSSGLPVLPIFIFDENILHELPTNDPRVWFIHQNLQIINSELKKHKSSLLCVKGKPEKVWHNLVKNFDIAKVYANKDYEPYALKRDDKIESILNEHHIEFHTYKDQVIFEEKEIVKQDKKPYTVFTPYKNNWLKKFDLEDSTPYTENQFNNFFLHNHQFPSIEEIGFRLSEIKIKDYDLLHLDQYSSYRDFPQKDTTSHLGPHLRFGTISIRQIISRLKEVHEVFLNQLIWREFFMQILHHFPQVVEQNFNPKYNGIKWRNNELEFEKWKQGQTGYPMVDAGMRQLNATGYMHNRARMITAAFLCKHLLIDWRWGEAYFAEKLLDYELASNNGNWQWAAGTGCDAAPYFRIFNPTTQLERFDKDRQYVRQWIPEIDTSNYPKPIVDHHFARERALNTYRVALVGDP